MSIQLNEVGDGKVLVIQVSGKLVKADYEHFVPEFERRIERHGAVRLLFDMTEFHGREASARWEDAKPGIRPSTDIERMAMVGETRWQHGMTIFCKPFIRAAVNCFDHVDLVSACADARAAVRYFDHADLAQAHAWLVEA